ncbi:hypothetical protein HDU98_006795 [Podochytrium sp. JEL0797]|nr:hypothetical protein HDU98_006795 [Podochytrium sp. JEL0797]
MSATIVPSFAPTDAAEAIDYAKVCKVFTGHHTATMYDRQEAILSKLARIYKNGLVRKDLPSLSKVLELAMEKINSGAEVLIPPFEKLLGLACLPFAQHLPGEAEQTPSDHITEMAVMLARITSMKTVATAELASRALLILIGGKSATDDDFEPKANLKTIFINPMKMKVKDAKAVKERERKVKMESDTYFVQIEKSEAIESLIESLNLHTTPTPHLAILKILCKLSTSHPSAKKLSQDSSLVTLLKVLLSTRNDSVFSLVTEILWNLLSSPKLKHRTATFIGQHCLLMYRATGRAMITLAFENTIQKTLHHAHKNLRNEFALVINAIVELCPESAEMAGESGFVRTVGHYLMGHELGVMTNMFRMSESKAADSVILPKFLFTNSPQDFEFKKILLQLALQLCTHHTPNLTDLLSAGLLEFLLLYLETDSTNDGLRVWNRALQLAPLQLQAIGFLNAILPQIPQKWASVNGNAVLLEYLTNVLRAAQTPAEAGIGGGTPASDAAGEVAVVKDAEAEKGRVGNPGNGLVGGTLRLLSRISELGPSQKRALGNQGAFSVLIAILTDRNQRSDIWRSAFLICSSLCQGCKSNKTLFGECGGVEMILPFLVYSSADPKETESVILSAVECIWGSICGSGTTEASFFAADGIFALLDLLSKSSYIGQRHILGCLLDLLENPKARSHVLEWRSVEDEQKGIANFLITLWNTEEQRLGVPLGHLGTLVDEKKPLAGKLQTAHEEHSRDGFVVAELAENLRQPAQAKIYSMFCKLGFDGFEESISVQEQIKLALIAKYLDFKIGEVWEEISDELDYMGIRPISPDLDCINTAKHVIVEKANAIQQKQDEIIKRKNEAERIQEDHFYNQYIKQRGISPGPLSAAAQ